jgi:ribosomal protein L12E/L44/L45/RPP1/RPP2
MSVLAQIQANEIINLRVSDADNELLDNVHKFIEALEHNHTLESIHFEDHFLGCLRNDSRSELLQSLGQVSSLQEVHLAGACMLVSDATLLLLQAKSLRVLTINKLVLQGVDKDFDAFEMEQCVPAVKGVSLDKLEKAGKKLVSATASGGAPPAQLQNLTSARTA